MASYTVVDFTSLARMPLDYLAKDGMPSVYLLAAIAALLIWIVLFVAPRGPKNLGLPTFSLTGDLVATLEKAHKEVKLPR
jgi:hypothetical protein